MKKVISICFILLVVAFASVFLYNPQLSNNALEQQVLSQQKYYLILQDRKVPIDIFVKPEWIPKAQDEEIIIQEVVATIEGNDILLDNVAYRENDIYFSFTTKNNMQRNGGILIANQIIEKNGEVSSGNFLSLLNLSNANGEVIIPGQLGIGPRFDFSLGVELEDAPSIQQGFYVKNASYMLYRYKKKFFEFGE